MHQTIISASLQYHFTPKSDNVKTGPIPVTSTSRASCPDTCPLKDDGGCYGENHGINFHWNALDAGKRGGDIDYLCDCISALPDGQLWRGNQVGDLPHNGGEIDAASLGKMVAANIGKRGFTYTHHLPGVGENAKWIRACNDWGFTVNLSANDIDQADAYSALDIGPVVTLLGPEWQGRKFGFTPQGRKIVVCPSQYREDVTCASCGLCQVKNRPIIGFIGHGSRARKVFAIAQVH